MSPLRQSESVEVLCDDGSWERAEVVRRDAGDDNALVVRFVDGLTCWVTNSFEIEWRPLDA